MSPCCPPETGKRGLRHGADHITITRLALVQLPKHYRRGRQTLIRTGSAGGTHDFVSWLARRGRWLFYSVGMVITEAIQEHVLKGRRLGWPPAAETDSEARHTQFTPRFGRSARGVSAGQTGNTTV